MNKRKDLDFTAETLPEMLKSIKANCNNSHAWIRHCLDLGGGYALSVVTGSCDGSINTSDNVALLHNGDFVNPHDPDNWYDANEFSVITVNLYTDLWIIQYISDHFRAATDKIVFWSEIHRTV